MINNIKLTSFSELPETDSSKVPTGLISSRRLSQMDIMPTAVKPRQLGAITFLTALATTSFSFGNGEQRVITVTVTSTKGDDIASPEIYISLYQGTVDAANEILGGGASVTPSQYQVIGPHYTYAGWDKVTSQSKLRLYILNISAGSVTINVETLTKVISNRYDPAL